MEINRRSFFAALAAPLLAPLRKLLPKPAAPILKTGDVVTATFAANSHVAEVCFWGRDGLYVFDGPSMKIISHQPYAYWHGQFPFVKLDLELDTAASAPAPVTMYGAPRLTRYDLGEKKFRLYSEPEA